MGGTVGNAHLAAGAYVQKPFQGTGSGRKNALGGVQSLGGVPAASRQGGAGKPGSGTKPSQQPMTSLFEQSLLLVGDAIAMSMVRKRDIDLDSLWEYHANLE